MKRTHLAGILCACVMPFALSSLSHAAVVSYTDQANFLAALPGSASTLNFDGLAAGTVIADGGTVAGMTFNYGSVLATSGVSITVTDGTQFGGGGPFDTTSGSNFLGTDDADIFQSGDDFVLSFPATHAIGMFFISADEIDVYLFDDDIELAAGGVTALLDTTAVQQTLPDGSNVFYLGIIDDMTTFSTASISSFCIPCGSFLFNIDDIVTATETQVPAPDTLTLLALGLAGLGYIHRRRRRVPPFSACKQRAVV